jgi:hypothetical protein
MEQVHSENLLRQRVIGYIVGNIPLQSFAEWFIPATWNIHEWAPDYLQQLVYGVRGRLAEYSNGDWKETELREQVSLLLSETLGAQVVVEPGEFAIVSVASPSLGAALSVVASLEVTARPSQIEGQKFNHAIPLPAGVMQFCGPQSKAVLVL